MTSKTLISPTRTPMPWRRALALLGAGCAVLSLGAALPGAAAAHPVARPSVAADSIHPSDQQQEQIQKDALALPMDLQVAIQRDLKISPEEYLTRSVRANNAARVTEEINAKTRGITDTYSLNGRLVAAVSNAPAEAAARAAGLDTKRVTFSAEQLDAALTSTVSSLASQGLDQFMLRAAPQGGDSIKVTVFDGHAKAVSQALASSSVPVLVEEGGSALEQAGGGYVAATPDTTTAANEAFALEGGRGLNGTTLNVTDGRRIQGSIAICSIGFTATNPSAQDSVITAGHCVGEGSVASWFQEGVEVGIRPKTSRQGADPQEYIGKVSQWRFGATAAEGSPGTALLPQDYAYIDVKNTDAEIQPTVFTWPNQVDTNPTESITLRAYGPGITGEGLCRSGRTSGWQCGTITNGDGISRIGEPDGTVHTVRGVQARVCSLQGDSGGSAIMGTTAVGVLSGGSSQPDTNPGTTTQCVLDRNGLPGSSTFSAINPILSDREGYFVKLSIDAPEVSLSATRTGTFMAAGTAVPGDTLEVSVDGAAPVKAKVANDGTVRASVSANAGSDHSISVVTRRDAVNASAPLVFAIAADGSVSGGDPSTEPTTEPTPEPTTEPTPEPTTEPTPEPTTEPTTEPTDEGLAAPELTSPSDGQRFRGNTVIITGTAQPHATLVYTVTDNRSTYRGQAAVGSTGAFRFSGTLPTGTWTLSMAAQGPDGTTSEATTRTFTLTGR